MKVEKADVYFIDDQMTVSGQWGSSWSPDGSSAPPSGGVYEFTPVVWKAKGTSNHPQIGDGDLTGKYLRTGLKSVMLDIGLEIGSTTRLGDSTPYWYFQPTLLMADLEAKKLYGAGSVRAWVDQGLVYSGACWWSKPDGNPPYGIRVVFGDKPFNHGNPAGWKEGDRLQLSIHYELP